jgi:hypothetical protein
MRDTEAHFRSLADSLGQLVWVVAMLACKRRLPRAARKDG